MFAIAGSFLSCLILCIQSWCVITSCCYVVRIELTPYFLLFPVSCWESNEAINLEILISIFWKSLSRPRARANLSPKEQAMWTDRTSNLIKTLIVSYGYEYLGTHSNVSIGTLKLANYGRAFPHNTHWCWDSRAWRALRAWKMVWFCGWWGWIFLRYSLRCSPCREV